MRISRGSTLFLMKLNHVDLDYSDGFLGLARPRGSTPLVLFQGAG